MQKTKPESTLKRPSRLGLAPRAVFSCLLSLGLTLPALADNILPAGLQPTSAAIKTPAPDAAAAMVSVPPVTSASPSSAQSAAQTAAQMEKPSSARQMQDKPATSDQATLVPTMSGEAVAGDISNFEVVSQALWRGGQPSNKAIAKLAANGVKTIIDLRYQGHEGNSEAEVAKQYGIRYVNIPLGFQKPSMKDVARFLAIVSKPANQPVFVHCRQGADRTGTVVGVFRILHDHWSFAQTYHEMREHHFKPVFLSLKSMVSRCCFDPKVSKELNDMAEKMEQQPAEGAKLSARPTVPAI